MAVLFIGRVQADDVDYLKEIKPVLHERCYACHGALKQEGGLRLDTAALMMKGGDAGAAIIAGDQEKSELVRRITATDLSDRMPPEGEPLTPRQIDRVRQWILNKAPAPSDEQPERDPRDHWAFQTPIRPVTPTPKNERWRSNPIDAFIAAEHDRHGLAPQRPSDRVVWLRRATIDLIGLPPTRSEMDAFLADQSPEAENRVVTRLLDSPQYGERWGRHWMDIWRYSDWWGLGAEVRNSQKHIWHWRDWIVESLNADKGYDQMLREMLAADELYPEDFDKLRAGGFLARQYFRFNRTTWLDGAVEHTSKAMLGLTMNCAKCHDHKYDPLTQVEYYRFRAFFEPYQVRIDAVPGQINAELDGIPRPFDCNLDEKTFLHIRGDDRNPDKDRLIESGVPSFLPQETLRIESVTLPNTASRPGLRPFVVEAHLQADEQAVAAARAAVETAKKELEASERASALATATPAPTKTADAEAAHLAHDSFAAPRPDLWEIRDGDWKYEGGTLIQSQVGSRRAAIRLKSRPPEAFEAHVKYVPRGGEMWKSVGISFDVGENGSEVLAYLSSYAGGPKAQIAYRAGGDYVYPANSDQSREVPLDVPHELVVRVRGTLVNLLIDGQPSVAYRLPIARQPGLLELITFDAKAEFLSFQLRELPTDVVLNEPSVTSPDAKKAAGPLPVDQAQIGLRIAEASVSTAEARLASIRARAAAESARFTAPMSEDVAEKVRLAVRSERLVAVAVANEDLLKAELAVLKGAADKKPELEKAVAQAKDAIETATKAIDGPGDLYQPLSGASKTVESNLESEESRTKPFPMTSTGRRSALARWITEPRHPLTARVAVNHIWSRHIGRPLVATVFDFGRKGAAPTHPELLDWLAVEFVESGWSMKHLHRLIVTSQAYRLSSSSAGADPGTRAADPDNRNYWRGNPIRMEAQVVRDSLLSLAGELDLTRGGPSIPASNEASRRRSLYYFHSHNEHEKFLSIFDDANVLDCYRRAESIVPQQALALENSELALQMAERIAARITKNQPSITDDEFLREAYRTVLCTEPTDDELAVMKAALPHLIAAAQTQNRPNPTEQARTRLVHALLNHNDFVTVR
jgi:mono/diheme cytochrome c family protein